MINYQLPFLSNQTQDYWLTQKHDEKLWHDEGNPFHSTSVRNCFARRLPTLRLLNTQNFTEKFKY